MSTLSRAISSVVDAGRVILAGRRSAGETKQPTALADLCRELLEHRGEASGLALASEICGAYQALDDDQRGIFFASLASDFEVDDGDILEATTQYREDPSFENLAAISKAVEAPRQKLFRRINMAPEGTRTLVTLRGHLLGALKSTPTLRAVDSDFKHLFVSWFNKGFLEMQRVDWNSPAMLLEKIIDYEAVHEINGWDDLRSRLAADRLCFAFFHPAMPGDPLVFVEVALTDGVPDAIAPLLSTAREPIATADINTVVFYSISNCHAGLAGISFGNFLIKQVVQELLGEQPGIKAFVTLSPEPGFRRWLEEADLAGLVEEQLANAVRQPVNTVVKSEVRDALMKLCAHYLCNVKSGTLARDPVARFHLGNGANLYRLNWAADLTANGKQQSGGIMVNYLYDLNKIEINHDAYFDQGTIPVSKSVTRLL
jgi:malonyl-CoA decarboxylase